MEFGDTEERLIKGLTKLIQRNDHCASTGVPIISVKEAMSYNHTVDQRESRKVSRLLAVSNWPHRLLPSGRFRVRFPQQPAGYFKNVPMVSFLLGWMPKKISGHSLPIPGTELPHRTSRFLAKGQDEGPAAKGKRRSSNEQGDTRDRVSPSEVYTKPSFSVFFTRNFDIFHPVSFLFIISL